VRSDDPTGRYSSRRLFEWTMAIALMGFGLHLMVFPDALASARFSRVLLLVGSTPLMMICLAVGLTRILSLLRNGTWPVWGPRLRAITAMLSGAIWCQLAVALSQSQMGQPSPGIVIYVSLLGGELVSVWRSRRDANDHT
jgi:hypothetical protein